MTNTAADRQKTSRDNSQPAEALERKMSLLVVEDDEKTFRAQSASTFSRAGYNVKTVEDGLMGRQGSAG